MITKQHLEPMYDSFNGTYGWHVPNEWQTEIINYLVHGFTPGSFHMALFANNLYDAVVRSHLMNDWESIMQFGKWILNKAPYQSFGSYNRVEEWLALSAEERHDILVSKKLLLTDEEVVFNILSA
jgi:hypothetical protein